MLWVALLLTIPLAGLHPVYVVIALLGLFALLADAALVFLFTCGEGRAESVLRQIADAVAALASGSALLTRASMWAALNRLLDAASLWCCFPLLGPPLNPIELFVARGCQSPRRGAHHPAGLVVIEASAAPLVVSLKTPSALATMGGLGWRPLVFWLPIPVRAVAYLTLLVPTEMPPKVRGRRRARRSR